MSRTLLIDGDMLLFRCSVSVEKEIQWSEWLWTLHSDLDGAIARTDERVKELKEQVGADEVVLAITDDVNWRKSVMPSYKWNRMSTRKPVCYKPLREYAHEKYDTYQRPTLEGDDILGILATGSKIPGEKVIWSGDKDLLQIPGLHWRDGELRTVSSLEGEKLHMTQTLTGDPSDGYPGCPGIGKVRAEKILGSLSQEEWWPAIVTTYEKAGLSEAVALENARVARICRVQDYDFNKKEVRLWMPHA